MGKTKKIIVSEEKIEKEAKIVAKKKSAKKTEYKLGSGKRLAEVLKQVDKNKVYGPTDAFDLVKKTSYSKFVGSVETHINVADKGLRGIVSLPHGTGKKIRVKVADEALIVALEKQGPTAIDFDILVTSPDMMPKLSKVAKILGPRGLMPNPKTNTISPQPEKLIEILSAGQINWKTENDFPVLHQVIGKADFETKQLVENFAAFVKSVSKEKIKSAFVKATMGPSIRIQI